MEISIRHFICRGPEVTKISNARYLRFREDAEPVFPQYAGEVLNIAELGLLLDNRIPIRVSHEKYFRPRVNEKGRIDRDFEQQSFALAGTRIFPPEPCLRGNVVEAGDVFRQRGLESTVLWTPSPELRLQLLDIVLGGF